MLARAGHLVHGARLEQLTSENAVWSAASSGGANCTSGCDHSAAVKHLERIHLLAMKLSLRKFKQICV